MPRKAFFISPIFDIAQLSVQVLVLIPLISSRHPDKMRMPLLNLCSFGVQPGLNQVIKADKAKDSTFSFLMVQFEVQGPFGNMEINKSGSNLQ